MRTKILVLFFLSTSLSLLKLNAQCADCDKGDDWHFAVGVTLHSNNKYISEYNLLERQPLELNFRYNLNNKHTFRLNLPFAWKVSGHSGLLLHQMPNYKLDETIENKAEAYWNALQKDNAYSIHDKVMTSNYNLFGLSVGYDFTFFLRKGFSFFAGVDLAYYYHYRFIEFYQIHYTELDKNNTSTLLDVEFETLINKYNVYLIKPQVGVRYQFQNLMLEGTIGYQYGFSKMSGNYNNHYHSPDQSNISSDSFHHNPEKLKQFVYQISLFYTF